MAAPSSRPFKLSEEAASTLRENLERAKALIDAQLEASQTTIANIYAGRDPGISLMPWATVPLRQSLNWGNPAETIGTIEVLSGWSVPEAAANLFLSRVRTLVAALVPGVPKIEVAARTPGATRAAEDQNLLTAITSEYSNLKEAMERASFLGLLSPIIGAKFIPKPDEKQAHRRAEFIALDPGTFGYEPHHRRFTWHTYAVQWEDFKWKDYVEVEDGSPMKPHELVQITEVYHKDFATGSDYKGQVPVSIFAKLRAAPKGQQDKPDAVGEYIITGLVPENPIVTSSFLPPAPSEDIPPAEAVAWVPIVRMIVRVLGQIDHEVKRSNRIILYNANTIRQEHVQEIATLDVAQEIYIPVDSDDENVSHKMRPVERVPILNELLATLNAYLAVLDDITGISAIDKGMAANPRKSATEAEAITFSANRQHRVRLRVVAKMFADLARVHQKWQRELYGKALAIPADDDRMVRSIAIPSPEQAEFSFRVDPIELENLSRRGEIESNMTALQLIGQQYANFSGSMPKVVRELSRRVSKTMGFVDVDDYLDMPVLEVGPADRYMRHLETGEDIPVFETDQHQMFIPYYLAVLERITGMGHRAVAGDPLVILEAVQKHTEFLNRAAQGPVGRAAEGSPGAEARDNVSAPLVRAGTLPAVGPQ